MLVKQLSVFMENRPGRLYKLTHALGKEGIDFVTLSIADTKDFGIVRFIARDNEKAYEVLKNEGFTVRALVSFAIIYGFYTGAALPHAAHTSQRTRTNAHTLLPSMWYLPSYIPRSASPALSPSMRSDHLPSGRGTSAGSRGS